MIPRVSLSSTADVSTISNPTEYLLVFNTATTTDLTPGLVYWKNGTWLRLLNTTDVSSEVDVDSLWALGGNNISNGQFLGTTNYQQLNFRANDVTIAQFHPNGSVALGRDAVISPSYHSFAIGEGANASGQQDAYAFGTYSNASGNASVAIGMNSVATQTNSMSFGPYAVSSGYRSMALGSNASASNNNAVAFGAYSSVSGQNSYALGYSTVVSGSNSAAVGYDSEIISYNSYSLGSRAYVSGANSIAIGYEAVADNPNTIILGNTSTNTYNRTKVGIGLTNPTANLDISGTMKYADGTEGTGKLLVSDANGNASWVDSSVALGGGSAVFGEIYSSGSTEQTFNWNGNISVLTFGSSNYENNVTATNSTISPDVSGLYRITFTISLRKGSGNSIDLRMFLATNGNTSNPVPASSAYVSLDSNSTNKTITINKFIHLDAGDNIGVYWEKIGGNSNVFYLLPQGSSFNIELLNYNY
ncbi:hypothetical protein [Neptunitalea lumnitzerae]|uniref:hypothetical protein n=1 Tax=Neptunitalea lumnitzerae TaxID=2965509 RepID=UPI002490FED2|nr:hypothetical protein [Neptunitalea sp. Y10]